MNKKFLGLALAALTLLGCERYDKYDIYIPSEYSDILNLKQVGEEDITLYNGIGEDGIYTFTVMKGGVHPEQESKATLRAMSTEELQEYAGALQRNYTMIPADAYSIQTPDLVLGANVQYVRGSIAFKSDKIKALIDADPKTRYVLPLLLESATDSVNAERRRLVLRPSVLTPTITFAKPTQVNSTFTKADGDKTHELALELPFESPWDFTAKVVWDDVSFGAPFVNIGTSHHVLANDGVVAFKKGKRTSEPLAVTLKNTDLLGGSYVIPLKIGEMSKPGIQPIKNNFYYVNEYNRVSLEASMLSTNAQELSEGAIANLIDGNGGSFFHSRWSGQGGPVTEAHYFQVDLKEPIAKCRFSYLTRNTARPDGFPQNVTIKVSRDGSNWEDLKVIDSGLPTAGSKWYSSEVLTSATAFSHIRFVVNATVAGPAPRYFHMAEFVLYGK